MLYEDLLAKVNLFKPKGLMQEHIKSLFRPIGIKIFIFIKHVINMWHLIGSRWHWTQRKNLKTLLYIVAYQFCSCSYFYRRFDYENKIPSFVDSLTCDSCFCFPSTIFLICLSFIMLLLFYVSKVLQQVSLATATPKKHK